MASNPLRALALALSLSTVLATAPGCIAVGAGAAAAGVTGVVLGVDAYPSNCDSEGCIYSRIASYFLVTIGATLTLGGGALVYAGVRD